MKTALVVGLCLVALVVLEVQGVRIRPCNKKSRRLPLQVKKLNISPNPIRFPGRLNVELEAELKRTVRGPIDVKVVMSKKTFLGYFPLPFCTSNVGSCEYKNICGKLANAVNEKGCDYKLLKTYGITFRPQPKSCTCPLQPTTIRVKYDNIELPKMSSTYRAFANGEYKIEGKAYDNGKMVGCFVAFAKIAS